MRTSWRVFPIRCKTTFQGARPERANVHVYGKDFQELDFSMATAQLADLTSSRIDFPCRCDTEQICAVARTIVFNDDLNICKHRSKILMVLDVLIIDRLRRREYSGKFVAQHWQLNEICFIEQLKNYTAHFIKDRLKTAVAITNSISPKADSDLPLVKDQTTVRDWPQNK